MTPEQQEQRNSFPIHNLFTVDSHGEMGQKDQFPLEITECFLERLPSGCLVGIGYHPDMACDYVKTTDARLGLETIFHDREQLRFWKNVMDECKDNNLKVDFLGDPQLWLESKCHLKEADLAGRNMDSIHKVVAQKTHPTTPYKDLTEYDNQYIRYEREKYIHAVMSSFLNKQESSRQMLDATENKEYGAVVVLENQTSCFEPLEGKRISHYFVERLAYSSNASWELYQGEVANRLLQRKHRAVTLQRIEMRLGRNPDFIGCWDSLHPEESLFEVYMYSEKVGEIVDGLGNATVKFTSAKNGSMSFTKKYDMADSIGASGDDIFYRLHEVGDGMYEGEFRLRNYRSKHVIMKRFNSNIPLFERLDTSLVHFKPEDYRKR